MRACVESLGAICRSVNTYPHLAAQGIEGNPERQTDAELATAGRIILDGLYSGQIAEWTALFSRRGNEGRATASCASVRINSE
jgi:hypothetical protein